MPVGVIPGIELTLDEARRHGPMEEEEIRAAWKVMQELIPERDRAAEEARLERERREARRFAEAAARNEREFRERAAREAEERARREQEQACWKPVETDAEFGALFLGSKVVGVVAGQPDGIPRLLEVPDVCWRFDSGFWLAMLVSTDGCPTCDYGTEKQYWTYRP